MFNKSKLVRLTIPSMLVLGLMLVGSIPGYSRDKNEVIDATAWGTSTQMVATINITLIIYEYSTAEDRDILVQAFQQGQNQGLVNALEKMKAVGRIKITGTLGYDVSFIRLIDTPTGRKIRLLPTARSRLERLTPTVSRKSFDLTDGEIELTDQDKSKSTGVLYPTAKRPSTRMANCSSN